MNDKAVLIILDGYGLAPASEGNAVKKKKSLFGFCEKTTFRALLIKPSVISASHQGHFIAVHPFTKIKCS